MKQTEKKKKSCSAYHWLYGKHKESVVAELDFLYILVNINLKPAHGAPGLQEREDGEPGPGAAGQEAPPQEDPPAGENSVSHTEDCMSRPSDA